MYDSNVPDARSLRAQARQAARNGAYDGPGGFREALSGHGRGTLWNGLARMAGVVPETRSAEQNSGALSCRWQRSSWAGDPDGRPVRADGGVKDRFGPRFDAPIAPGGYAWWYLDALSDDGKHGLTLIAFVGSVFSPYYAWARRDGGKPDADQHCAINVALTGAGGHRWAMTERDKASMTRSAHELTVGPSRVSWNGRSLVAEIDEVTAPFPARLKGRITLHPAAITETTVGLDAEGRHFWSPIAPVARVEVRFEQPGMSWNGLAYLDSNAGTAPLEEAFKHWCWSRTIEQDRTRVLYDVLGADGAATSLAVAFGKDGTAQQIEAPPAVPLRSTRWRVPRATRAERQRDARVLQTWEDGPFYARSLIETTIAGERVMAVHESLSLDRFKRPIVQAMLPFRMPRHAHAPRS